MNEYTHIAETDNAQIFTVAKLPSQKRPQKEQFKTDGNFSFLMSWFFLKIKPLTDMHIFVCLSGFKSFPFEKLEQLQIFNVT